MDLRDVLCQKAKSISKKYSKMGLQKERKIGAKKTMKSKQLLREISQVKRGLKKASERVLRAKQRQPETIFEQINDELKGELLRRGTNGQYEGVFAAEAILDASEENGQLQFLVKFGNVTRFIDSHVANHQWPQLVIRFYEDHLVFEN